MAGAADTIPDSDPLRSKSQVGDDPLSHLPEPYASVIAEWRAEGRDLAWIVGDRWLGTGMAGKATTEAMEDMLAHASRQPRNRPSFFWEQPPVFYPPPTTVWRIWRGEVLRRIEANNAHAAAEAEAARLAHSAALDAVLEAAMAKPMQQEAEPMAPPAEEPAAPTVVDDPPPPPTLQTPVTCDPIPTTLEERRQCVRDLMAAGDGRISVNQLEEKDARDWLRRHKRSRVPRKEWDRLLTAEFADVRRGKGQPR